MYNMMRKYESRQQILGQNNVLLNIVLNPKHPKRKYVKNVRDATFSTYFVYNIMTSYEYNDLG